jgi:hypothetical protein
MKVTLKLIAIISVFLFNAIQAQQVVKTDTLSGTAVTITMDKKIEDLLSNLEDKCTTTFTKKPTKSRPVDDKELVKISTPKISIPEKETSRAEICQRNPRIMGYKIQFAVVKSNEEAKEVGMYFRQRFPNMKVEIDASLRPNYKVMAGSYVSKQSAASDLSKIRTHFKSATAIQYRVFCVEAK